MLARDSLFLERNFEFSVNAHVEMSLLQRHALPAVQSLPHCELSMSTSPSSCAKSEHHDRV